MMKKSLISLLVAFAVTMSVVGVATAFASSSDVPEPISATNVAFGKEAKFKSLDMTTDLEWSAYSLFESPYLIGQEGYSMLSLTDGDAEWSVAQNRAPATANTSAWVFLDLGQSYIIDNIKVGYLSAWVFTDVVIQVSDDPTFASGVTTIFATNNIDGVYDGEQVGCTAETMSETGWNGFAGVNSVNGGLCTYDAGNVSARYVRMTDTDKLYAELAYCQSVTTITEIQVYAVTSGVFAPTASVASGTFYAPLSSIELSTVHAGGEIRYTLDGSYPTKNSTLYTGAIDVSGITGAFALRAITVVDGKQSESADFTYTPATTSSNVALGKAVSFRSLTDINTTLDAYAFFPDGNGDAFVDVVPEKGTGIGQHKLNEHGDMARLTDGLYNWNMYQSHSTAPNTRGWAYLDLGQEYSIENIKVGYLSTWCFTDVVIQVSNDSTFASGVSTIFATNNIAGVYDGGQIGCGGADTGWNSGIGVDSVNDGLRTYSANGVTARYVRLTNNTTDNGGAKYETVFNEIQVYNRPLTQSANVAYGKEASFRKLDDVTDDSIGWSAYNIYVATNIENGDQLIGQSGYSMLSLTDGVTEWSTAQNRAQNQVNSSAWVYLDLGQKYSIDNIKVSYLSAWTFKDVVIQVSDDPTFASGVTTIFATNSIAGVYEGGQVGCNSGTADLTVTGWDGVDGVASAYNDFRTYAANGVTARYVRLTNNDRAYYPNQSSGVTTINELQVFTKAFSTTAPEIRDTIKSVSEVLTEIDIIPGATKEDVTAALPSKVAYTTMSGASGEITLDWDSEDWQYLTEGTFTFTATPTVTIDDMFGILPETYSVNVAVNKADTSALDALIEEVENLNSEVYTQKTWSPLANLVSEAKAAIAEITVTEETIASYIDSITEAKAALKILATDKTELAAAVDALSAIDADDYMSATVAGLESALTSAIAVNNDDDASEDEVAAALNALNAILNGLVEKGDVTALTLLVNEIKTAEYNEENYERSTYVIFVDALAAAERIIEAEETPKTEVDAAYEALENAFNGLVEFGDNTELVVLIDDCQVYEEENYTSGSWAEFAEALADALSASEQKLVQEEYDSARDELLSAEEALVSVVELKAAIASTIDEDAYTAISVLVWKEAKTEAQLILDNPDATAEEIAEAVAKIEAAKEALVEVVPDEGESGSESESDSESYSEDSENKPAAAGCMSAIGGFGYLAIAAIFSTLIFVFRRRRE